MSTHKHIDRICCAALAVVILLTVILCNAEKFGIQATNSQAAYESRLFDTSRVHTIDIVMDNWDDFLDTCTNEEYEVCSVIIDNEQYRNVGIRAKGNTSLSSVAAYGNDRYSFKLEFDHYDGVSSYHGLNKVNLNNIIQDNTYMKDYLVYQLMGKFGVASPLCSYVYVTVNGEEWGLYLAVEGVEEDFLERNYGKNYGELYKPDSMSFGGGRGNGKDFDMSKFNVSGSDLDNSNSRNQGDRQMPNGSSSNSMPSMPDNFDPSAMPSMPDNFDPSSIFGDGDNTTNSGSDSKNTGGFSFGGMGSSDVKLQYIDDDIDSYSNIFDNAKTDVSKADKKRLIQSLKTLSSGENIDDVVDVEAVIRYFVVHNFVCNYDSYTGSIIHNYYLYEDDGVLSMIPWDYNLAFGGFQAATDATSVINEPIDSPVSGGSTDDRPMLAWIFNSEEYTQLYHQYFAEFIEQYFSSGYTDELIAATQELIAPYVEKDPTKFCTYDEFEAGVSTLREFCKLRAESVSGQLDGTIPSTSDGQSQDNTTLIDASSISISAMGSMGNGMGNMGTRHTAISQDSDSMQMTTNADANGSDKSQLEPPNSLNQQNNSTDSSNAGKDADSSEITPENGMQIPDDSAADKFSDKGNFSDNMPDNITDMSSSESNSTSWILFGVSVLILLAGLLFAFKFKQ